MAELISFAVPTQSDKVLLVWELSAGPPAEALRVSGRTEGREAGTGQGPARRGTRLLVIQQGVLRHPRLSPRRRTLFLQGQMLRVERAGTRGSWVFSVAGDEHSGRGPPTAFSVRSVLPVWSSVFSPSLPERCSGSPWFLCHHQVLLIEGRAESPKGM